ncbi:hypothetical protein P700755_003479 [Psychroflexus torquis ATCC 700755]|uniref:Lipoprotein n=1 Tax=Psychroflexus torquis (strain ATCC 700755 / CIP 106069 / ACAM 623) TaxID=313595 RepID=K4IJW8_PSYTT|nr:hypothetical protein [Psychroflexus torquis]AFU70103.1 hypothetical protein P700755_003479 [Psychroflexus torquis ATCC 700755]
MKDISFTLKFVFLTLICGLMLSCENDKPGSEARLDVSFIRFSFQTDSNNEPLQFPNFGNNQEERSGFTLSKRDTIKLPLVLTTPNSITNIEVVFKTEYNNVDESNFSIFTTSGKLQFDQNQLSDTIYIVPNKRLQNLSNASIDFQINSISDSSINIGYPNTLNPLDRFSLSLVNFEPVTYQFDTSSVEIEGVQDENYFIDIEFDQIVNSENVNNLNWLDSDFVQNSCSDEVTFNFDFNLEIQTLETPSKKLRYSIEILENFENIPSSLNIRLQDIEDINFTRQGQNLIQFFKSGEVPIRSGDPAASFYNVSNRFYRTFGKAWAFDETDNECQWQNFQSFTRPVEVESGSEFDNGTGFHKYKIGFRNIIRNPNGDIIGTNPFNLRRFYDGASVLSPAFSQMESLEFFPENEFGGSVKLSIQNLEFLVNGETINIPVCGNGTYTYDSENDRWEIFLTFITDETQISGNPSVEKFLYIYNENVGEDPEPLNGFECGTQVIL